MGDSIRKSGYVIQALCSDRKNSNCFFHATLVLSMRQAMRSVSVIYRTYIVLWLGLGSSRQGCLDHRMEEPLSSISLGGFLHPCKLCTPDQSAVKADRQSHQLLNVLTDSDTQINLKVQRPSDANQAVPKDTLIIIDIRVAFMFQPLHAHCAITYTVQYRKTYKFDTQIPTCTQNLYLALFVEARSP